MVQTSPTSHADQARVPGATAVRVLGVLLILLGVWKSYAAVNVVVQAFQRGLNPNLFAATVVPLAAIGLATIIAGILLVRRDSAGKVFGLVVCAIALAYQLISFGSTLSFVYFRAASPPPSLGMLFWLINAVSIALFLVSIIAIACWRPYRVPGA
jgi:hypothetical protein